MPYKLAGQEGFEPPTPGFGVRRSTVRATGLQNRLLKQPVFLTTLEFDERLKVKNKSSLFGLFMQSMLSAESTVFTKLQFVRRCPFIFGRCVVSSFAFTTCKCNNYSHKQNSFALFNYFANNTCAHCPATFPYGKPQLFFHRDRCDQLC